MSLVDERPLPIEVSGNASAADRAALLACIDRLRAALAGDATAVDAVWSFESPLEDSAAELESSWHAAGVDADLFVQMMRHRATERARMGALRYAECHVLGDTAWVVGAEAPARGGNSVTALYHFVLLDGAWRVTARFAARHAPVLEIVADLRTATHAAHGDLADVEAVVGRHYAAHARADHAEGDALWAPVAWAFQAAAAPAQPASPEPAQRVAPADAGASGPELEVFVTHGAGSIRAAQRFLWPSGGLVPQPIAMRSWVAGEVAWVLAAEAAPDAGQATAEQCAFVAHQLVRLPGTGWRLTARVQLFALSGTGGGATVVLPGDGGPAGADETAPRNGTVEHMLLAPVAVEPATGRALEQPLPVALEWGWNTGPDGGARPDGATVRPVTAADGWAPWRDLLVALASTVRTVPATATNVSTGVKTATMALPVAVRWEVAAFAGALLVYVLTRLWRLGEYPLYFFTDEAFEPLAALDLIRNHFRGPNGVLLPMYFQNGNSFAPVLSVYAHALTVSLFGKSVEVARGTAAVFTVFGAAAAALTMKYAFKSRLWWSVPLLLATTPAWFVHSRTTFETVFMVSFYALFVLFYLLYRCQSPWYLYPAVFFAGCTFYSYTNGQAVIGVAGLLLAIVDVRYHLRRWKFVVPALVMVLVLALPYVAFTRSQPAATTGQLDRVSSYMFRSIPLSQKLVRYKDEYFYGLSPKYWFFPNNTDLNRHVMAGYGHLRVQMLPFFALGLAICLWQIRSAPYRTLIIAGLAAPSGAAIAAIGITRVLSFVLPACLVAMVGLDFLFRLVRPGKASFVASAALFVVLAGSSFQLLGDALTNGPLWFKDYGLSGQQWGAKQIFDVIPVYLKADPKNQVLLSSTWANGADLFVRFFTDQKSPDAKRVAMGNVRDFMNARKTLNGNIIFIMTPEELKLAQDSRRFNPIAVDRTLNTPDGKPGFYFVRLGYSSNFEAAASADRERRRALVEEPAVVDGENVLVRHSLMDAGSLKDIFDGEPKTLGRFNATNPAAMEMRFPQPRHISKVTLVMGAGNWETTIRAAASDSAEPQVYTTVTKSAQADPTIEIPLDRGPDQIGYLRVEMRNMDVGEDAIIHLRDLLFR